MSDSGQNRVFHYAVLASLALHALLFLGFPDLINSARRAVEDFPPPILARLIAPEPAVAPPAAAEKPPAPPPVQKPAAPKAAKPLAKPVPAPEPEPAPAADPQPAPPAPVAPAEAPPAPALAETAQAPVASVQPGAPPREARTIGEYRLELIEAAKRIKDRTRYPPLARDNNWTGQTQVRVALAANGTPGISVKGTSGHQILDQHALTIFRQATREVSLPADLRGREFAIDVWMDFTLTQ